MRQKLENLGTEVIASTPEEFTALQNSEIARWTELVREAGIKAE